MMPNLIDISGRKFGRLIVISRNKSKKKGGSHWNCICDCGNKTIVYSGHLKNGKTRSCGCYKKEKMTTHGLSKFKHLFSVWCGIVSRCKNSDDEAYDNYGGRGISVCDEWCNNAKSFFIWAYTNGYRRGLDIDRIDNDGNYEPSNCRFATKKENSRNRRTNRIIEFRGEKKCLIEWSEIFGINKTTLRDRIENGWSIEDALLKPVRKRCVK